MSDQGQQENNEVIKDIRSILSSVEDNRFWPFAEGVYIVDTLKPWAAAAYTFIAIILDNKAAMGKYDAAVYECDQRISKQFRQLASNLLTKYPVHVSKHKGSQANTRMSAASQWPKQFNLIMKQYFSEKWHILSEIIDPWIQEYFKPARGEFGNAVPMSGILHVAMIYETISNHLVEEPPEGFEPQAFYDDEKPTVEFIHFMHAFRDNTGITDPGSWEALKESEFYKALNLTRKLAREKVKEARRNLIGIHCYGDRTLLRDAYCFKRVVLDGDKEASVAAELRSFREAQYTKAERLMADYRAEHGGYYLTRAILDNMVNQRVLTTLFTADEMRRAPRIPSDWEVKAKPMGIDNPTENEVSKAIATFAKVFEYPRSPGRPAYKPQNVI